MADRTRNATTYFMRSVGLVGQNTATEKADERADVALSTLLKLVPGSWRWPRSDFRFLME